MGLLLQRRLRLPHERLVSHSVGSPSVARTAMVMSLVCVLAQACAWSTAPWSAADVGVDVLGPCFAIEAVRAAPTPGSGAISTSGFA